MKPLSTLIAAALAVSVATAAEAQMPDNPVCEGAWNTIFENGELPNLASLLRDNCAAIYRHGWTSGEGFVNTPICEQAWSNLEEAGVLGEAQTLVEENCAIICSEYRFCK